MAMAWQNKFFKTFHYPKSSQIYILPTKVGIYHIVGTLLGVIFALSYANPMGIFFIFLWFCFILASAIAGHRMMARTMLEDFFVDHRCFENQEYPIKVQFNNDDWDIYFRLKNSNKFIAAKGNNTLAPGLYTILDFKLISRMPFGLFQCWTYPQTRPIQFIIAPIPHDYGAGLHANLLQLQQLPINSIVQMRLMQDQDLSGSPIQLDYFSTALRMHWKRMAQTDKIIGLRPDQEWHRNSLLPLEQILLPHLHEKIKQALHMIKVRPADWSGVLLADGKILNINSQLPYNLAQFLTQPELEHD